MDNFANRAFSNQPRPRHTIQPSFSHSSPMERATNKAVVWLAARQYPEGDWCGQVEGDSAFDSEYVLLHAFLGQLSSEDVQRVASSLLFSQQEHGGWSPFPGGPVDLNASVKAYLALKLTGQDIDSPAMSSARNAILAAGGLDRINGFTRFHLAILGLIDYSLCPAIPPEAIFMTSWLPISVDKVTDWSRSVLVPMSLVWAKRPKAELPDNMSLNELCHLPPDQWRTDHHPSNENARSVLSWDATLRVLDRAVKGMEELKIRPLRRWAMKLATKWINSRFAAASKNNLAFPMLAWSRIAMRCLEIVDSSPAAVKCDSQITGLLMSQGRKTMLRVQPCQFPIGDTAKALLVFETAGIDITDSNLQDAVDWLIERQIKQPQDKSWQSRSEVGGWPLLGTEGTESHVEQTAWVLRALRRFTNDSSNIFFMRAGSVNQARFGLDRSERVQAAADVALNWLLSKQRRDGGWTPADREMDGAFAFSGNPTDNFSLESSSPETTAIVLSSLVQWGFSTEESSIARSVDYLLDLQSKDGYWHSSRGGNIFFVSWQVISSLLQVGIPSNHPTIVRATNWLELQQHESGGWGHGLGVEEGIDNKELPVATIQQTAWAVLSLMAINGPHSGCVNRGIEYLLERQLTNGSWEDAEPIACGSAKGMYFKYNLDSHCFPMMALTQYRSLVPIVPL
jgi:squalene-hopene/tetraprenyl-beta-curcumene cyclase